MEEINLWKIIDYKRLELSALEEAINADDTAALFAVIHGYIGGFNKFEVSEEEAVKFATRGAELGDPLCMAYYAFFAFGGIGGPKDIEEGTTLFGYVAEWIEERANEGHPYALLLEGLKHLLGIGVEKNADRALACFNAASELGEPSAQTYAASCYMLEVGTEEKPKEALRLYKAAAKQEYAGAQYALGRIYGNKEEGYPHNLRESGEWLKLSADQGHIESIVSLGTWYSKTVEGRGGPDYEKAINLYITAANRGNTEVLSWLGYIHSENVKGAPHDFPKAIEFYTASADAGEVESQRWLAALYYNGNEKENIPASYPDAVIWLEMLAEKNDRNAIFLLGSIYVNGRPGVSPSRADAIRQYSKLANNGDEEAQLWMANMYTRQVGDKKPDFKKALELYKPLAEKGYALAMQCIVKYCSTRQYGIKASALANHYRERLIQARESVEIATGNISNAHGISYASLIDAAGQRSDSLEDRYLRILPEPVNVTSPAAPKPEGLPGLGASLTHNTGTLPGLGGPVAIPTPARPALTALGGARFLGPGQRR